MCLAPALVLVLHVLHARTDLILRLSQRQALQLGGIAFSYKAAAITALVDLQPSDLSQHLRTGSMTAGMSS